MTTTALVSSEKEHLAANERKEAQINLLVSVVAGVTRTMNIQ